TRAAAVQRDAAAVVLGSMLPRGRSSDANLVDEGSIMGQTLQSFAKQCHEILKAENNPAGRKKVSALLEQALKDEQFVATNIPDNTPERKILYEDPELGFCILAHNYSGAKDSSP